MRFEDFSLYWHSNDPAGSCLNTRNKDIFVVVFMCFIDKEK
jgi:hypothetical protein